MSERCDVLRLALDLHRTFCKRVDCTVLAQVECGLSRVVTVGRDEEARSLFSEIAEGSGAFSRDPLTHAANCIDSMKALALKGVALYENPSPGSLTGAESGGGSGQVQNAMDQAGTVKSGSGVTAGETAPACRRCWTATMLPTPGYSHDPWCPRAVHVPAKPVEQERFCNCGAENCTPFPADAKTVEQHEEPCKCCGLVDCRCSIGTEYGDDRETGPYSGKWCSEHARAV